MGFTFCFELKDGRRVCFDVPAQLERKHPVPDPGPWFHDVSILTSIVDLASRLRDDQMQRPVLAAATASIGELAAQLPPGIELHRDNEVVLVG